MQHVQFPLGQRITRRIAGTLSRMRDSRLRANATRTEDCGALTCIYFYF